MDARLPLPTQNLEAAQRDLNLTPQERALYQRHLTNLYGPGGVDNPDGSRSTLYQMGVTMPDGRTYNLPTVYDGRILPPSGPWADNAMTRAQQQGLDTFPSYQSPFEAENRYQQMHNYMDRDTAAYFNDRQAMARALMDPNSIPMPTRADDLALYGGDPTLGGWR
jgi:hypothetical protein